jgi:diguanylate cyclase (GGDEF)-like protein
MVLLIAVGFIAQTGITLALKRAGEQAVEARYHLGAFTTELQIEDGLEGRAMSGRVSLKSVRLGLTVAHGRADAHLDDAQDLGLSSDDADSIATATDDYRRKVDTEVALLASGATPKAVAFNQSAVAPAFGEIADLLKEHSAHLESRATRDQLLSNIGILLTVLLSLILVTGVQSARRQSRVRSMAEQKGSARYRTLIDQSSDLVAVVDRDGLASFVSPSVDRLLASTLGSPFTPSPCDGVLNIVSAVDQPDRTKLLRALETAASGSVSAGQFRFTGDQGTSTFQITLQDLTADPSVNGLVLTGHDVTESLELHQEMEHRSLHDTLTGLPNRALLSDRFEQALRGAERDGTSVGLLLLDLDRFKEVNDTFGHHHGDELLRQIGPRLASVLRGGDTIARLGGDEFAVLLPDVHGVEDATKVATALLTSLALPFLVEGVDLDVEASVGVVISGVHGKDALTLMQHADIAMYVAKAQHSGVVTYDPTSDGHSATKLALVGDLRRALDCNELVLYYQPQISISTGDLVGAEALVRWQHPVRGLVFPDEFIPVAENTGLIKPLTRHIMNLALAQARVWLDAGRPLPIAVNLSARNLHDHQFADMVSELLAIHGVPPDLLELEATETAIMVDPEGARLMMEKLSALGVRLSIDDFGAGYTSLSQLTSMPIREIKIDRSFIMTMADVPGNAVIVRSVVDLGHNLGLTLVAEGVENEHSMTALAGLGCDVAQGYHLSRPIPVTAFDAWCAGRSITPIPKKDRGRLVSVTPLTDVAVSVIV